MAGDDHPDNKVFAAGESSKGEAVLEEGEIPEDNVRPPPSPPPSDAVKTWPAASTITVEAPPIKKLKIINAGGSSSATAPVRQVPCPLCNRMFDSFPAMFGHQRVHKERTYRGAYPPPTFNLDGSPPPPPAAEETEVAARRAAQLLIDMSKGVWEKGPAAIAGEASTSTAPRMLGLDLNLPLEAEEEAEDGEKKLYLDLNKSPQDSD